MRNIKGNILLKLHNCFFCHKTNFLKRSYPKIEYQHSDYLTWCIKQYQLDFKENIFSRESFLMKTQVQNLSLFDIKNMAIELNFFE